MPIHSYLDVAVAAAQAAGTLLRQNFGTVLDVNEFAAHDIKLDLDVRAQDLITGMILERFPEHAIYGEEGIAGNQDSDFQWIVDPIDGTVNYFYSIPHYCVSIALRERGEIIVGVIYDPARDELWQVAKGGVATLNGKPIAVSSRTQISEATLSIGFFQDEDDDLRRPAAAREICAARPQMPPDGERRPRPRLRRLRTTRCLHRTVGQPVGRCGGQDSGRVRRRAI